MTQRQIQDHLKEYELLPCPFCGGPAHVFADFFFPILTHPMVYRVGCDRCSCLLFLSFRDPVKASIAWNSRASR